MYVCRLTPHTNLFASRCLPLGWNESPRLNRPQRSPVADYFSADETKAYLSCVIIIITSPYISHTAGHRLPLSIRGLGPLFPRGSMNHFKFIALNLLGPRVFHKGLINTNNYGRMHFIKHKQYTA